LGEKKLGYIAAQHNQNVGLRLTRKGMREEEKWEGGVI